MGYHRRARRPRSGHADLAPGDEIPARSLNRQFAGEVQFGRAPGADSEQVGEHDGAGQGTAFGGLEGPQERDLQAFYAGETQKVPSFFSRKIKTDMGPFYQHLPGDIVDYLEKGAPFPGK